MPLSLTEFGAFCDAVKISDLDQKRVAEFVAAGNARRAAADPFDAARISRAFKAIDLDDSGQIDLDELVHFGQAVGQGWTRAITSSVGFVRRPGTAVLPTCARSSSTPPSKASPRARAIRGAHAW